MIGRTEGNLNRLFLIVLGALMTALPIRGGEQPLPGEPCTQAAVDCAPFPDRMSAYVWRNWFVVPHARLAAAVGASEAELEGVAVEMGLPAKVDVLPEWRRRGYITVVRRNWHLLDYPQLLQVIDMTREELAFSLMEDDFLFVKLGNLKPKCGELKWKLAGTHPSKRLFSGGFRGDRPFGICI